MYDTAVMDRRLPSFEEPLLAPPALPAPAPLSRGSHLRLAEAAREAAERAYLAVPANDIGDSIDQLADALVEAFFASRQRQDLSG